MNILFLTMSAHVANIHAGGIYSDLMRCFRNKGHDVYILYPQERRLGIPTYLKSEEGIHLLGVKTLNVTKTNVVEKGIGQILLEYQFKSAIKAHLSQVKFDLILYSTPPITFTKVIEHVKRHNPNAKSYLLLKDIFPQNAVDLGMLSKTGPKGILYNFFRKKEKKLYQVSDYIGCMSPANVRYLLEHNPELSSDRVEVAPNSCDIPRDSGVEPPSRKDIRSKYHLPIDKPVFIYGGNMGKPQGIPFLIDCMKAIMHREDCHFVLVGDGTDYHKLETFVKEYNPKAVSVFRKLPKEEYDQLAKACDVGLIFLDYRFSIPNYPSRLLSYLMEKKPIIAATDPNCDTGTIAEENGYGYYCPSNTTESFVSTVEKMLQSDITAMGERGYQYFLDNCTTQHTYNAIINHFIH